MQVLEVREFEKIIEANEKNQNLKRFDKQYQCLDKKTFHEFLEFIHEFEQKEENSDILNFITIGYKKVLGQTITFKNYVGLIQLKKNVQIQILPKIAFLKEEKDETKKVFLKMLRSMKDFSGKTAANANLNPENMNLYEIFINLYIQEVRRLVKNGIKSSYLNQEENLNVYKGKLLVNEHLKQNIVHKERFYVVFDEYQANCPQNRLIKSTLLKLQQLTGSAQNSKEIRQLLVSFELVEPSKNYEKDFSKVVIDRTTKCYEVLFPMEKVFEAYVAKNLKKRLNQAGWEVSIQDKGYYLFDTLNGEKYQKFALRPDLVITRPDESIIILDTKWKSLINNKKANYGISQADMYQMYAYAKKYQASEVWLLYPMNEEMKNTEPILFDSGDGVRVSVFLVDVAQIEESLEKLFLAFASK